MYATSGSVAVRPARRTDVRPSSPATRVLHVINGEIYGGAERVQDLLALSLARCGFEVGFACLKPDRFAAVRLAQAAPLYNVPMRGRTDLRPILRLAELIRREGYSLVHTHTPRAAMVGRPAAALAGVPMVHHVHSQTSVEVNQYWLSRINSFVERASLSRAAGLIAVSDSLCGYLRRNGYSRHRIWIVPNGVPFPAAPPVRSATDRWTLGLLALFRPRKGLEVLLEALAILRSSDLPVRLRAVGEFQSREYEREVIERARKLGVADIVDWVGFRREVGSELRKMDILVLPSLISEGLPMSVLEAMAFGTTIVGTRVDGVTDVIRDGEDGLLARPGDPEDLARVLASIIRGEVDDARLRQSARRRQEQRFSDESMASGVADVYREVLEG